MILDLGCGHGTWALEAIDRWGPETNVVAFDLVDVLCEEAKTSPNVQMKRGNL